jgi:DNA (cytosine-5)-methyltransferase 1
MSLRYLSVCSGIEAASVAWHELGWTPVGFSEIEPFPCAVLKHRFPTVPNFGDMTKYKEWKINDPIDLIVGGTPCQAFSVAGLRKGLADPRGNLTLTFLGMVERFRPRWVIWENVPGVLSERTWAFGSFLGGLGQLGYGWAYRILDAQYFGVAQRRRRVFVVANTGSWQRAAAVLFEPACMRGDSAPSREAGEETAGTLSSRTTGGGGLGTDFDLAGGLQTWPANVAPTLNAQFGAKQGLENQHALNGGGAICPRQNVLQQKQTVTILKPRT